MKSSKRPQIIKVKFLDNVIKNEHTFLQALPHPDHRQGKVHNVFIMYSGLEIATHWSPMRPKIEHWQLNFQNWSPAGD